MSTIAQVIASTFILLGALLAFTAAVGIVRFPDTLSRMHAATKPQVVGLIMVLVGAIISLRGNVDIWMLVLVGIFTLVTAPVIAHTVGRVAYREQRGRDGLLIVNEMEPNEPDQ
ncbi:Na+/H+ antiporter subunit G [Rhodococcoides fascians]|jgi:multicomponent Na+:H+ antiporter subunit G|uniref:monovalent cation/H(+) antiporter subunit G n=1 Tax=Nocardiaceae TaxID=85025 RepID=UPI00050C1F47|nr:MULTISPECIES: monovalent cation/H(+) antiporter subunit G [Rhodococcus]KJV04413.1 putative multisubunit Na+:H+ antiporter MnhG subunit [Rhodococcus sp. PML026]MBJ7324173.1 monovalent cation/H(+) antiporter subunit G [Rhodococcus sp. (in: high G+C Gram-positive bacteria)]MBW4782055.1 monovalent cation/H(+) antiporter subunit G [Rhodococcus fascians]MCX6491563.1 monovalent cation/H(+) antiporter subunit G [Rhodococcus sp. (in: high G+C Gram-positive bacteria)]MDJ0005687.1 monovalent cation/H(